MFSKYREDEIYQYCLKRFCATPENKHGISLVWAYIYCACDIHSFWQQDYLLLRRYILILGSADN